MTKIDKLKNVVSDLSNELLLFDESQHDLFLKSANELLQSGYSIGPISKSIIKALQIAIKQTAISGVYTLRYKLTEPTILCFSSGTKNSQKGIVRTYQSWQNSFSLITKEVAAPTSVGIVLGALPYSLSLFGAMESLERGISPLLFPSNSLKNFNALAVEHTYTLWATPSHCSFFINAFAKQQCNPIKEVRYIFVGGAHFSNQQRSQLQLVFPNAKIFSYYGTSETSFISIKSPTDNSESVGTICKDVEVSIRNEQHKSITKNTSGNIWIKSNQLFLGYLQKVLKIRVLGGYISINDRGFVDRDNRLFFSGRKGRRYSINGHVVDLEDLEKWYKKTLSLDELALFVIPHTTEDQMVLCSQRNFSDKEWQQVKQKALSVFDTQGVPKKWVHCHKWPLLKNGKVDMQKLKHSL